MDKIKEQQLQKELTELFIARMAAYDKATHSILEKLPSVTEAIYDLIGLPHENVTWKNVDYDDGLLILQLTIAYTPAQCPAFVKRYAPPHELPVPDEDIERIEQLIRLGVPRQMAFGPKEDIVRFFSSLPFQESKDGPQLVEDTLTEEQLAQLKMFQYSSSAMKH